MGAKIFKSIYLDIGLKSINSEVIVFTLLLTIKSN